MAGKKWTLEVFLVLFSILQLWSGVQAVRMAELEMQVLDEILQPGRYDPRVRPAGNNSTGRNRPLDITMNMFLIGIPNIDDVNMKFTIQLYLRQRWADSRLTFDDYGGKLKYLSLDDKSKIWMPDIFFPNELAGHVHNVLSPNSFIRIKNGSVLTSSRLSLTFPCRMNMKLYPFDYQVCEMKIESYNMDADVMTLSWAKEYSAMSEKWPLPYFHLNRIVVRNERIALGSEFFISSLTGEYTCLKLQFLLERHLIPSVMRIFIPSSILVSVSWLSFWLGTQAVVARVIIGVATVCAVAAHAFAISWSLAPVGYMTSLDIWFGTCLLFVMSALLVSITVNYKNNKAENNVGHTDALQENADTKRESNDQFQACLQREHAEKRLVNYYHNWVGKLIGPSSLDIFARVVFPLGFVIFSVSYWAINLSSRRFDY